MIWHSTFQLSLFLSSSIYLNRHISNNGSEKHISFALDRVVDHIVNQQEIEYLISKWFGDFRIDNQVYKVTLDYKN